MANCTVRVELHDATWQNYVDLANDLARYGIVDEITASNGITYKMPPAEYNYEGTATTNAVLNTAREAANRTGRSNAVLVSESARRTWLGLEPVQTRRRSA
jgi:hypothetical protein